MKKHESVQAEDAEQGLLAARICVRSCGRTSAPRIEDALPSGSSLQESDSVVVPNGPWRFHDSLSFHGREFHSTIVSIL